MNPSDPRLKETGWSISNQPPADHPRLLFLLDWAAAVMQPLVQHDVILRLTRYMRPSMPDQPTIPVVLAIEIVSPEDYDDKYVIDAHEAVNRPGALLHGIAVFAQWAWGIQIPNEDYRFIQFPVDAPPPLPTPEVQPANPIGPSLGHGFFRPIKGDPHPIGAIWVDPQTGVEWKKIRRSPFDFNGVWVRKSSAPPDPL